jgi:hypothetical protein
MTKSGISRLRAVVRNATTGLAVLACFAPMPAMAQEETSLPVIGNAALPRDLTPLGMFLNADIVVKAVLIGLVIASVITWTVWLAKTIELIGVKRRLRKALSALASARSTTESVERISTRTSIVGKFLDGAVAELQPPRARFQTTASRNASHRVSSGSKQPAPGGSRAAPACLPPSGRPLRSSACSAPSGAS